MNENQNSINNRRYPRISTLNLVDYELFNGKGVSINQGAGKTINLSQNGTLLETDHPLKGAFILLMTFDLDGKKVTVKGRVVRSGLEPSIDKYLTGIEFMGSRDIQREVIVAFVKAYQHRKHVED